MKKNTTAKSLNNRMLNKLRIEFVIIAMISLVIMQSIIIYISGSYIYNKMLKKSDILINEIYEQAVSDDSTTDIDARYFYVTIDSSGKVSNVNNTNNRSVRPKEAASYYREIASSRHTEGFYNGYRYKLYNTNGSTIAIFLLRSSMIDNVRRTIQSMIIVSVIGLLIMLVFLILISTKMVLPIAKSYQKQKEFITSASHELKTPLSVIKADVDVIMMDNRKEDEEWLLDIKNQVDNMTSMTNSLVTLARMDERAGNIITTSFIISDIANEIINSYKSTAIKKNIHFTYNITPDILYEGDLSAIRQLFSILLDNAFKYGISGGNVHIALSTARHNLLLEVSNDIETIDNNQLEKMFDRFYRSDSASSKVKGYGLGLSIAKAIVTGHKGTIYAKAINEQHTISVIAKLPL